MRLWDPLILILCQSHPSWKKIVPRPFFNQESTSCFTFDPSSMESIRLQYFLDFCTNKNGEFVPKIMLMGDAKPTEIISELIGCCSKRIHQKVYIYIYISN